MQETIAKNIIDLRKSHNLTQIEFAKKLNYSDNAVSRWERAEVTPNIETLVQISDLFNISINDLLKERATEESKLQDKKQLINKLAVTLIFVSIVWLVATIAFVYGKLIFNVNIWQIFIWAVPASCLVMYPFNEYWGKYVYKFVILSVLQWTLLGCIYLQFLQ